MKEEVRRSFQSTVMVNSLIGISSLHEDQRGTTNRLIEDLEPFFRSVELPFEHPQVSSAEELTTVLDRLAARAAAGMRPVIHFDMHAGQHAGLRLSNGDELPWPTLCSELRAINAPTRNNLVVVFGTCFGLYAVTPITLNEPCPFNLLIASQNPITFGFLEDSIRGFYEALFTHLDIAAAYDAHLAPETRLFQSEQLLATALAEYVREGCIGRGGAARRERLLTEVYKEGLPRSPESSRRLRSSLRKLTKPGEGLLDRYREQFLHGAPVGFTVEDLVKIARQDSHHLAQLRQQRERTR